MQVQDEVKISSSISVYAPSYHSNRKGYDVVEVCGEISIGAMKIAEWKGRLMVDQTSTAVKKSQLLSVLIIERAFEGPGSESGPIISKKLFEKLGLKELALENLETIKKVAAPVLTFNK